MIPNDGSLFTAKFMTPSAGYQRNLFIRHLIQAVFLGLFLTFIYLFFRSLNHISWLFVKNGRIHLSFLPSYNSFVWFWSYSHFL